MTMMMLAVALVPAKESARARVQASAAALAEAYAALVFSGFCAAEAETRTKRPCSLRVRASWKARVVSWRVRTSRAWSQS